MLGNEQGLKFMAIDRTKLNEHIVLPIKKDTFNDWVASMLGSGLDICEVANLIEGVFEQFLETHQLDSIKFRSALSDYIYRSPQIWDNWMPARLSYTSNMVELLRDKLRNAEKPSDIKEYLQLIRDPLANKPEEISQDSNVNINFNPNAMPSFLTVNPLSTTTKD